MGNSHTSKQFDAELESLRSRVLQMGGLVEEQIINAIDALMMADLEVAERVIQEDVRVNALEVSIDEDCSHIIARRQPTASDLRLVTAVIKTITDLERIGDEAQKIARLTKLIYESDRLNKPRYPEIRHMANDAIEMLRHSLDAFARLDTSTAAQVLRHDLAVDEEFRAVLRHLITFMMEDPRTISVSLDIVFVAKAIERIGDHAKNMAEYVIYMVKGKDVRHIALEEAEREAL